MEENDKQLLLKVLQALEKVDVYFRLRNLENTLEFINWQDAVNKISVK